MAVVPLPINGSRTTILSPCAMFGIILLGKSIGNGAGCSVLVLNGNDHTSVLNWMPLFRLNLGRTDLVSQNIFSVVGKYLAGSTLLVLPLFHIIS